MSPVLFPKILLIEMKKFIDLFRRSRGVIIGMVHLRALPGSPQALSNFTDVIDIACKEAEIYTKANVDAIMIENMHDRPWQLSCQMTPETVACMTAVCHRVRQCTPNKPLGVQVLSAGNKEALAIAKAADLNFIRAEGFVFSHIGDEGPVHSCAAELVRYRKLIDAEHVQIYTDVKKKHCSHTITSDTSIADTAAAAELFLSDGIIVTGKSTGQPTNVQDIKDVQQAVNLPVLIGSGVNDENLAQYLSANAIIIGSHLKRGGLWSNEIDNAKLKHFMAKVNKLRSKQPPDSELQSDGNASHYIHAQGE